MCGEQCRCKQVWIMHAGRHSDSFVLSTDLSIYDSYDITDLNFVSLICRYWSLCILTYLSEARQYWFYWSSCGLICSLVLLHGAYNPHTSTDELSCLRIQSLKWRINWHWANTCTETTFLLVMTWEITISLSIPLVMLEPSPSCYLNLNAIWWFAWMAICRGETLRVNRYRFLTCWTIALRVGWMRQSVVCCMWHL